MTGITHIAGIDVRRALAARRRTVVTAKTVATEARVINHRYRRPCTHIVTGVAFGGRLDMTIALARGRNAVMAATTRADHLRMIYRAGCHRRPLGWRYVMTGLANRRGRHVRPALAAGVGAIVATDTISGNATVIDRRP